MDEYDAKPRIDAIYKEIENLVQEYIHLTDSGCPTGVLTNCVVSIEAVRYDDRGDRVFRTDYLSLGPNTYSGTIGILHNTLWRVHHDNFGHCGHGD